MRFRSVIVSLSLLTLYALSAPVDGQTFQTSPFEDPFLNSAPDGDSRVAPPRARFRLLTEISLPGPLPGSGPRLVGDRIEIPVAGGTARTGWTPDAPVVLVNTSGRVDEDSTAPPWVEGPRGRFRYTAIPSGWIVSQRRCRRCSDGWRGQWRLRVSGSTMAPPLVTAKRIYFGALDNHVYSVKRRSGHRIWSTDVEQRVSTPLLLWSRADAGRSDDDNATEPSAGAVVELLLVVPDDSSRIVALDPLGGQQTALFELPDEGDTLVGRPLITPDGRIVVARQRYAAEEASLLVLEITAPPPAESAPPEATANRDVPNAPAGLPR